MTSDGGVFSPSRRAQIELLKEQTRLTGALHEAQTLQLRIWPLVVYGAQKTEFSWDPDKRIVNFRLFFSGREKLDKKDMGQKTETLTSWVQALLGSEWKISVQVGKMTLRGKRNFDVNTKYGSQPGAKRSKTK